MLNWVLFRNSYLMIPSLRSSHRCTRVENRGSLKFLPKSWVLCQSFQEKLPRGPPIPCFISILLTSVFKFAWGAGGPILTIPLPPPPTCVCMGPLHDFRYYFQVFILPDDTIFERLTFAPRSGCRAGCRRWSRSYGRPESRARRLHSDAPYKNNF
jgi:hypothetical protein